MARGGRGRGRGRGQAKLRNGFETTATKQRRQKSIEALTSEGPSGADGEDDDDAGFFFSDDDDYDSEYGQWGERDVKGKGKARARSRSVGSASSVGRSRSASAAPSAATSIRSGSSEAEVSAPSPSATPHIPPVTLQSKRFYQSAIVQSYRDTVKTLVLNESENLAKRLVQWGARDGGLRRTRIGREERRDVWRKARHGVGSDAEAEAESADEDEFRIGKDRPEATKVDGRLYDRSAEIFTLWPLPPANIPPNRWSITDEIEALHQRHRPWPQEADEDEDEDDPLPDDLDGTVSPNDVQATQELLNKLLRRLTEMDPRLPPEGRRRRLVGKRKRQALEQAARFDAEEEEEDVEAEDEAAEEQEATAEEERPAKRPRQEDPDPPPSAAAQDPPPPLTIASLALQDFPAPRRSSHVDIAIDPSLLEPAQEPVASTSGNPNNAGTNPERSKKRKATATGETLFGPTDAPMQGATPPDNDEDALKWEYGQSWINVLQAARDVGVDQPILSSVARRLIPIYGPCPWPLPPTQLRPPPRAKRWAQGGKAKQKRREEPVVGASEGVPPQNVRSRSSVSDSEASF